MADDDTRQIVLDIYEKAYKRQRGRVDSPRKSIFKNHQQRNGYFNAYYNQ